MTSNSATSTPPAAPKANGTSDTQFVVAGLKQMSKKLNGLASELEKLGRLQEASTVRKDQTHIDDVLLERTCDVGWGGFTATDKALAKQGLEIVIRNLRAAAGTVRALGKDTLAADFKAEADDVEHRLLPTFSEQTELQLHSGDDD